MFLGGWIFIGEVRKVLMLQQNRQFNRDALK